MPLDEDRAKRDFDRTPEPRPGSRARRAGRGGPRRPIFVVQEHHASRLHYDFRLEADGVLKSWSVPKGPSLDPGVKRLAVQVEDHPIAYAGFAGDIPPGQYGAGHVEPWDRGTYEPVAIAPADVPAALAAGRLEFALHGERLRGRFTLLRMKGRGAPKPRWLLIKARDEFARAEADPAEPVRRPARRRVAKVEQSGHAPEVGVELTHPERVLFPEAGLTKAEVFAYYRRIAPWLLPFLNDRPITLERLPEGLSGPAAPHFWQKDSPASYPDWIPRIALPNEAGKTIHYALVNDEPTLLYLVNQGAFTFHPWLSRVQDLDRPDLVLFDLDPGSAPFSGAIAVAKALRAKLDAIGVEAFVKTSGKSGLHVLVSWDQPGGFDEARAWALEVAEGVAADMPDRATVEIRKAKRGDRVYIDVLQNARGHHAVPPYVVRSIPRASVSTPLAWRELTARLDPAAFTPRTLFRRLAGQKADPLAGLLKRPGAGPTGS